MHLMKLAVWEMGSRGALLLGAVVCLEGGGADLSSVMYLPPQTGKLQLYDLASGSLVETLSAHDGAVWSIALSPDQVTHSHPSKHRLLHVFSCSSFL